MRTYEWSKGVGLLLLGAAALTSTSCGDEHNPVPVDGTILVGANTTGTDFDPNGYLVSVNSSQGIAIGNLDTIWVTALEAGNYNVALAGVAENCLVAAGTNPQEAAVVAGDTVEVLFDIACEPPEQGGGGPGNPQALRR
jgi:hypothetical protein